jgi:hypothetical protein
LRRQIKKEGKKKGKEGWLGRKKEKEETPCVIRQAEGVYARGAHIGYARFCALLALYKANADQRGHSSSVRSYPHTLYRAAAWQPRHQRYYFIPFSAK